MNTNKEHLYSMEMIESIIANPDSSFEKLFKQTVISMIASNKNDLLWYANFLSRCEYEFHFNELFTSAVYFNGKNFVIALNPVIFGLIEKDQVIAILKHSAGHIINHHFHRKVQDESVDEKIVQIAKDIVINGNRDVPYIQDLPTTGTYKDSPIQAVFYQTLEDKYKIESYEVGREFEYYVELIVEAQKNIEEYDQSCSDDSGEDFDEDIDLQSVPSDDENENSKPSENGDGDDSSDERGVESETEDERDESSESFEDSEDQNANEETSKELKSLAQRTFDALNKGECRMDSHEFGEQLQEEVGLNDELFESFMETTLKEMIEDSTGFARGFTPSDAIEALGRIEKRRSHKDWKKIFNKKMRNYLSNSMRYREPNKARQHPIYPDDLDLYGYSPSKKPKIGVVLDVSGSVDEKLFIALISEIKAVQRKYAIKSVMLVQVDSEIKSIEKFQVHDKFIMRKGSGGTVMESGFSVLLQQSSREIPDIIICATDGDIERKFEHLKLPNKVQVIWLVEKSQKLLFDISQYSKQQMQVIEFSL